jgi:plasmid stabilization system protein ParE
VFKYITLKRSRKGDGHHVVYEVDEANGVVNVLRIFHTKMDLKGRLESEVE